LKDNDAQCSKSVHGFTNNLLCSAVQATQPRIVEKKGKEKGKKGKEEIAGHYVLQEWPERPSD